MGQTVQFRYIFFSFFISFFCLFEHFYVMTGRKMDKIKTEHRLLYLTCERENHHENCNQWPMCRLSTFIVIMRRDSEWLKVNFNVLKILTIRQNANPGLIPINIKVEPTRNWWIIQDQLITWKSFKYISIPLNRTYFLPWNSEKVRFNAILIKRAFWSSYNVAEVVADVVDVLIVTYLYYIAL